jgi:lipid-binding SYLF domain-containing protein
MNILIRGLLAFAVLAIASGTACADEYADTIAAYKNAGQSASFFSKSYGYAVFPTVGKGGLVIGAAHGNGHVFAQGKHVGDASMTQVSVGFQAGGQAYSEIVFFEDKHAFDEFTHGDF